jgi:putative membrane protein
MILSIGWAVAGAIVSSLLACVPGLHIYNIMGLLAMAVHTWGNPDWLGPANAISFAMGLIVGYALVNSVPSILLAAPDESALFTVLPGQKYLLAGRGYEGVMVTAAGGLAGLVILLLVVGPLASRLLPAATRIFRPHVHWILWCVIAFMLLSEWPKGGETGQAGWRRLLAAWRSTGAGLVTFLLSGLLGFILLYRSPVSHSVAFQNLMPAFVGLFTLPWLILNIASRMEIPPQRTRQPWDLDAMVVMRGALAGGMGGGFAAFFPIITGGVGGFLAGHATAQRDDRVFMVSQGASKFVYYVGGFLLLFVPGLHLTRGGGAWLISGIVDPRAGADYAVALTAMAVAGVVALLLIGPLSRGVMRLIARNGYRRISVAALALVVALVAAMTGSAGLLIMLVATGIGLIPVACGSRRMNCLGVILLPMSCNMSGVGAPIAGWLGLL